MFSIWAEWDLGHEGCVFTTEAKAIAWLEAHPEVADLIEEEEVDGVHGLVSKGLIDINKLQVDPS